MKDLSLEEELRGEAEKWLVRAERAFKKLPRQEGFAMQFYTNIEAYLSDSHHFLKNGDLIRAYEAVIWAWAWMEIGEQTGILSAAQKSDGSSGMRPQ